MRNGIAAVNFFVSSLFLFLGSISFCVRDLQSRKPFSEEVLRVRDRKRGSMTKMAFFGSFSLLTFRILIAFSFFFCQTKIET